MGYDRYEVMEECMKDRNLDNNVKVQVAGKVECTCPHCEEDHEAEVDATVDVTGLSHEPGYRGALIIEAYLG